MYYDYGHSYYDMDALLGFFSVFSGISLLISIFSIVCMWKIFTKAHEEGWAAIVPFYNLYVLYKITWGSGWYFLLLLIPIANIVIAIFTDVKLAQAFNKGGGFACGLVFLNLIFMAILAFSDDIKYVGIPNQGVEYGPGGGYQQNGGQQGGYQNPYQSTYTQQSSSNPDYRYQRTSTPAYCPYCGAQVEQGAKFCASCGRQL